MKNKTASPDAPAGQILPNRKTGMARLWELAFRKKILVTAACVFSVASTALSFSPFIAVYYIIRELVIHFADLGGLDRA
ncbi:MAG: hypothetical protein LBI85_02995, partial [Spirochaetaceae bacterium]|nr:hypothetical protein [Spirochaetaceae bacterium]